MSVLDETQGKMESAVTALEREFQTVRTGKAVPTILDSVRVSAYGGHMPLNQVSTVSAGDAALLLVQPFDPSLIENIEKAILASDLGLNPSNDGSVVRVPVPPLSEERRREYVRMVYRMAEDARISVRRARHFANNQVRRQLKRHELGEDDAHRLMENVQKLTDKYGRQIHKLLTQKEKEVMAI